MGQRSQTALFDLGVSCLCFGDLFSTKLCPWAQQKACSPPLGTRVSGFKHIPPCILTLPLSTTWESDSQSNTIKFPTLRTGSGVWVCASGQWRGYAIPELGRQATGKLLLFRLISVYLTSYPQNRSLWGVQLPPRSEICSDTQVCEPNQAKSKTTVGSHLIYSGHLCEYFLHNMLHRGQGMWTWKFIQVSIISFFLTPFIVLYFLCSFCSKVVKKINRCRTIILYKNNSEALKRDWSQVCLTYFTLAKLFRNTKRHEHHGWQTGEFLTETITLDNIHILVIY